MHDMFENSQYEEEVLHPYTSVDNKNNVNDSSHWNILYQVNSSCVEKIQKVKVFFIKVFHIQLLVC